VAGGQVLRDGSEQALRGNGDLIHGALESQLMLTRRLAKPAHLANELPGGSADLLLAGDHV